MKFNYLFRVFVPVFLLTSVSSLQNVRAEHVLFTEVQLNWKSVVPEDPSYQMTYIDTELQKITEVELIFKRNLSEKIQILVKPCSANFNDLGHHKVGTEIDLFNGKYPANAKRLRMGTKGLLIEQLEEYRLDSSVRLEDFITKELDALQKVSDSDRSALKLFSTRCQELSPLLKAQVCAIDEINSVLIFAGTDHLNLIVLKFSSDLYNSFRLKPLSSYPQASDKQ